MQEKKEISQKIINYAIWYYLKYFPSINKLKQKLDFKFWPNSEKGKKYWWIFEDDINFIVNNKLWDILVEKQIITSTINNYINKWKNLYYIKSKLNEKWFNSEEYLEILSKDFNSDNSSLLNYEKVFKQVQILYKKNKSRSYIRNKFVERNLDAELVDSILDEVFVDWEGNLLKKELEKIIRKKQGFWEPCFTDEYLEKLSFEDKQKIIQKLVGKGFSFGEVRGIVG